MGNGDDANTESRNGDLTDMSEEDVVEQLYNQFEGAGTFEQKAQGALELGRLYLGVQNAHLTRIDQATDHWESVVSTDDADGAFPPGLELDFGETYCRRTLASDSKVTLHNAPEQGWSDDVAFDTHGLHCYLGTPLLIQDEMYGTLCFVNEAPREAPFSEAELMFVELIARMLERELERQHHEAELLRQSNLALVLNRVLRHNLRNNVTVIGGYVKMMAEKLDNDELSSVALDKIEDLIKLGDRARELDQFIATEAEPETSDVGARIQQIIASVRESHPSARIVYEPEEAVTAELLPSFDRAIEEVIENAAKHSGKDPTIVVTVQNIPDAIEIRIEDDGPGISEQEVEVLRTGAETPLTHGSGLGLWLVHWIISSQNGTVAASATDSGTTMTITLPRTGPTDIQEELRTLARARDQFEAAFDHAPDGMVIIDDETHILEINEEAAQRLGGDRTALLGRQIAEFLPNYDPSSANHETLKDATAGDGLITVRSVDGSTDEIDYSAVADVVQGQHLIEI